MSLPRPLAGAWLGVPVRAGAAVGQVGSGARAGTGCSCRRNRVQGQEGSRGRREGPSPPGAEQPPPCSLRAGAHAHFPPPPQQACCPGHILRR